MELRRALSDHEGICFPVPAMRTSTLPAYSSDDFNAQRSGAPASRPVLQEGPFQSLHTALHQPDPTPEARERGAALLRDTLARGDLPGATLPEDPNELHAWMARNHAAVAAQYEEYLAARREGAGRRYFTNRAHALYFLRAVAPTKLVDGSWLYGLLRHARNPRLEELVRTYLEELGDGAPDKNHVVLYRQLMARYGLVQGPALPDALHEQGAVQLALAWNAEDFLPEVIGFNLGYEQLPLHLLITAYELNELGIDPYYFTLHVTVDNADTGHARQACDAVLQLLPRHGDADAFWHRVREGARLGDAGLGTARVIADFDIAAEVVRIFQGKCGAGQGMHSDYCRVAGRSVNAWLSEPERMDAFLEALVQANWIRPGRPVAESRFWGLLQGPRAEMFGVFSPYELQVIHDWIRGAEASADGQAYFEPAAANEARRRPTFRALHRARREDAGPAGTEDVLDSDLVAFKDRLRTLDAAAQFDALVHAMSPSEHWTPVGLYATRRFVAAHP
ncbi:Iron-containing redox enzyme [Paracidovorax konjaci]|uniref:Iron-containing redox enzyme n=2 Tax=Paracidovorax konjaci TaxID=32040 RepID=A0A1I1SKI0_9BURK|nr:Iron-containing redox enzyme [Paracidovorax konjaci]